MEFDEVKKIWDAQNNQPLYAIDEKTLHNRIRSRMNAVRHVTNISDWVLIVIYIGTVGRLLYRNPFKPGVNTFIYLEAVWILATVVYFLVIHLRRIKAGRQFDRSIHGDLDHAISLASYQVRLSEVIRWNLFPLGAILILSGWESGKLLRVSVVILVSYTLAFYVISIGLRLSKRRKRELRSLKEKLEGGN